MGIKMNKSFDQVTVAALQRIEVLTKPDEQLDCAKYTLDTLCYFYEICLAHDLTKLTLQIETEFRNRNQVDYIVPRTIFTQFNASMISLPFAKVVWETKPGGVHLLLQDCADRYSPPSFGWLISYILAAAFKKGQVAQKIAETIQQHEPLALCMPRFIELATGIPEIAERISDIYQKLHTHYQKRNGSNVQEDLDMQEDIEKHDELNPALFENNKLKPEVREKALEVADELLQMLQEAGLTLKLKDIIITGSNASYNYTKDSDVDLHLVADTEGLDDPDGLYPILFNSFKSAFNKKYEINFYDVPVEVYIETADTAVVSNGIYSVQNDEWVQEPKNSAIPDIDTEAIDKELEPWIIRYEQLVKDAEAGALETEDPIDDYIADLYEMREKGLRGEKSSEYSNENLIFKEIRNLGYLDKLKELRDIVVGNRLSLVEQLDDPRNREALRLQIQRLTYHQPIIQPNGLFEISNVPENEVDFVLSTLRRQNFIKYVQSSASRYDFSRLGMGGRPSRKFNIYGQIK
jgi:predicted nucleotidyltransferase